MENRENVVIVVGAGSTYSDGAHRPVALRPPLNMGFFRDCQKDIESSDLLNSVRKPLMDLYGVDPLVESNDNLEGILVKVHSDMLSLGSRTAEREVREEMFRNLVSLLNSRMANTTNGLKPAKTSNIRRILSLYLDEMSFAPKDICLVTFNYDLHIERNLHKMSDLKMFSAHKGEIFNFPHLYGLGEDVEIINPRPKVPDSYPDIPAGRRYFTIGEAARLSCANQDLLRHWEEKTPKLAALVVRRNGRRHYTPKAISLLRELRSGDDDDTFPVAASSREDKISLLKLHGSLNWYSAHTSSKPSYDALSNASREIRVTYKTTVGPDTALKKKKRLATYPVVVPPIVGKATVFHQRVKKVWAAAQKRLNSATEVVVFGYSFPPGDYESINMLENTVGNNKQCRHVRIINPDPSVVPRMGLIPRNKPITLFPDVEAFLAPHNR